jgi:prolyl-tRNA editing enzyme YbaK/EbsC (Cys-tRNA(Pro) deacylase)
MRTSKDLGDYMQAHGIQGEVITLHAHTPTVDRAAAAVGTKPENIVKSLLFLVGDQAVMAIASGKARVENATIADHYDVDPKQVRLADAAAVERMTGFPVGAVPPFGHTHDIPTLIDPQVLARDMVYAGGGEVDALLHISPREIARATSALEVDLRAQRGPNRA